MSGERGQAGLPRPARVAGRILIIVLAFYGLVESTIHFVRWRQEITLPSDAVIGLGSGEHGWLSPGNNFKAVPFLRAGGGGFDPYCLQYLVVAKSSASDNQAWSGDKIVEAGCNAIKDVVWTAKDRLQVSLDPNAGSAGVNALLLKGDAAGGQVRISYVFVPMVAK